jgi:hypothetical protein
LRESESPDINFAIPQLGVVTLPTYQLEIVDYSGPSKCGKHLPYVNECKEMDRMNDGLNCLIFKDQKEYEEGNRNVGEMMDDSIMSQELPDTDLTRMKNNPNYRANLTYSMTKTLAATLDAEVFEW